MESESNVFDNIIVVICCFCDLSNAVNELTESLVVSH